MSLPISSTARLTSSQLVRFCAASFKRLFWPIRMANSSSSITRVQSARVERGVAVQRCAAVFPDRRVALQRVQRALADRRGGSARGAGRDLRSDHASCNASRAMIEGSIIALLALHDGFGEPVRSWAPASRGLPWAPSPTGRCGRRDRPSRGACSACGRARRARSRVRRAHG